MKQFGQAYMKRNAFLSIMCSIMDNLKYSVTFMLNIHKFGSIRKQNIEKISPMIEDDLPCRCHSWHSGLLPNCMFLRDGIRTCNTCHAIFPHIPWWGLQFFCYICAGDVGRIEHLRYSTIFVGYIKHLVSPKWSISIFCNRRFVTETSRGKEECF